jgi:hypothetical protein
MLQGQGHLGFHLPIECVSRLDADSNLLLLVGGMEAKRGAGKMRRTPISRTVLNRAIADR